MSAFWIKLEPGESRHYVSSLRDRRTACGRAVTSVNNGATDAGPNPCRKCWARVVGNRPPQDREPEESMVTKTKSQKKPKDAKGQKTIDPIAAATDPEVQSAEKMKKIRAQRRVVKKHELEVGNLKESMKIAREELDAALTELYRLIDGSGQGDLYVGTEVHHIDRKTGEVESDDEDSDEHDDTKVTLSAGGKSATTTLGGMKRATEALAGKS